MQPSYQSGFYAPGRGVAKHPELWRGCVGAWNPGLGNTGLALRDWSGNQNNGVLTNGPTWGVSDGRQALSFDGSNDSVQLADNMRYVLSGIESCTITAWVSPRAALVDGKSVFSWPVSDGSDTSPYQVLDLSYSSTYQVRCAVGDGATRTQYTATDLVMTQNVWAHIVSVWDGSQLTAYLNGKRSSSQAAAIYSGIGNPATKIRIGSYRSESVYAFNGLLSDVRIYNRSLSPNEIRILAQRPGIAYELAPRKTYFIPAATSTSRLYDVLSPLIFAGTN